jgi:acetoin utilization deacetylase AcuC-like enzyme
MHQQLKPWNERCREQSGISRRTGLVFFPAFDWAISATHPEREERLLYTKDQLFEEGLLDLPQIAEYKAGIATEKDVARVHFCVPNVRTQITDAHLISVGSAMVLADAFMQGEVTNAFALVRPPGHHAMRVAHGNRGFCNINNEAIMIEYLRQKYGLRRIAIVDTDVHHGDGTQDIFYHDPDVLFISFHQDGRTLYPGSGFVPELGGPGAYCANINIPLPPGTSDEGIHYVLDNLVLPILRDFDPELVVYSAGQDNHYTDPLASMRWTTGGYALLNEKLKPDLAVLEGGYSIETALPYINTGIILAMAGLDYSRVREPDLQPDLLRMSREVTNRVHGVVGDLQEIWAKRKETAQQKKAAAGPYYQKQRRIYYDTDQIEEEQRETIKMCPDCLGYHKIESKAERTWNGQRIVAVSIPLYACAACQQEGRAAYAEAKAKASKMIDVVYLQDKKADEFWEWSPLQQQEKKY